MKKTLETLTELQKKEAIERMKTLHLLPKIIQEFKDYGQVYYSERGVLYYLDNETTYMEMVEAFEKEYNALVYHAHFGRYEFGDVLSLFYVSKHTEEWEMDNDDLKENSPFVYCINLSEPSFSEFGCIGIKPLIGGVDRTY